MDVASLSFTGNVVSKKTFLSLGSYNLSAPSSMMFMRPRVILQDFKSYVANWYSYSGNKSTEF